MSGKLVGQKMIVKVLVGSVMLSGAWGSMALSAGQEKAVGLAFGATASTTQPAQLKGKIGGIDGAKIDVLTWPNGDKEPTHTAVTVTDGTTITINRNAAKLADLKANMYVTVTLGAGGVATTVAAYVPSHSEPTTKPHDGTPATPHTEPTTKPHATTLDGKIAGINGNKIDFQTWHGDKTTHTAITANSSTTITIDGNAAKLSDVKANSYATVTVEEGGIATALNIRTKESTTKPATLVGTIYAINGNKIDVLTPHTRAQPTHTTVIIDDKTIVTIDGEAQLASALKVGLYVHVTAGDGGVVTIEAHTPTHK
jgi:hypothetical protein